MKVGCHISISGGIEKAPRRAAEAGCECFQIFTRSPRGGVAAEIEKSVAEKFLSDCEKFGFSNRYVHTPYIINLASKNEDIRKKSADIVTADLKRSELIGVKFAVTHIGSRAGMSNAEAVERAALSINEILDKSAELKQNS